MIVIRLSILLFALAILQGCNSPEPTTATNSGITKAEIRQTDGNYQLFVNGEPFFIEGAGLEFGNVEALAKHGGNSFRTWRTDNGQSSGQEVLDRAQANGLLVTMGIEVARERHGFDYNDEAAVKEQFERIKTEIQAYKDHPALIIWAIGNELNLRATNPKVWDAVNQISEYIHEVDPNHLTTSTLAGIDKELVDNIKERASDLDLLSIQMYADIVNLKQKVTESGWTGPYMVTEWGATGHWEVGTTAWEAPIENNSTQKANFYLERYQQAILPNRDQCVGSYVFLWGQKQERTPTWYGMFMPDGEETASVDVMHYLWNDTWPDNRSPQLDSFLLNGQMAASNIYLEAGKSYTSEVFASDPDGDALTYHYEIKPESTDLGDGGDHESVPPSLEGLITESNQAAISFTAPETEGAYRILVTVADGQNHMGHANIPFYVKARK
ncbi:glycoside hydrolase family 2 TIM barrel-domain containing protein [Lewinella sp. LCG006]|uniref:glycoside hydrolase family 2 TIM barrel-domain containing protein n=1 Tax=Lewinella sp. LCG006 TaxID=3231911 RepID=UPI0034600EE3